jgi:F-type H+-transporting ATPase subunit delta
MPEHQTTKHETVMDVTAERLARVYADAFWKAASKQAEPAAALDELRAVVTDVLDTYPAFDAVLASALVDQSEKVRLLDRVFGSRLSPTALNFLKVLSAHNRLELLRLVVKETQVLLRDHLGQVEVDVRVASEMDVALAAEVLERIRSHSAREPILRITVDPELVGGIIIKVGDRVYDGSLKTRFEMARRSIIERASQLIEADPGHFIQTAG